VAMFKKAISIVLLIFIQLSAFTQIYGASLDSTNSYQNKKTIQESKSNSLSTLDAFENELEDEDDTDIHAHYYLLPISFILQFNSACLKEQSDFISEITLDKKHAHCPIFITTRQLLI
jgi:hypothetical protein